MTVAEFREAFPQFTKELFPDVRVDFYIKLASRRLNPERWGDLLEEGLSLLVAHNLTLEAAATKVSDGTGGMEAAAGAVISETKTVGSISKSIGRQGSNATGNILAGEYNETVYGKQYYRLVRIVGMGGTVV